jgi:hypothetical protein
MNDEIGLQELIYQVKHELLTPNRMAQARDPEPTFVIDKIELEIQVKVTRDTNGTAKITVLGIGEVGGDKSVAREHGHTVRVSLASLVPAEEVTEQILQDPEKRQRVERAVANAIVKGQTGLGEKPE